MPPRQRSSARSVRPFRSAEPFADARTAGDSATEDSTADDSTTNDPSADLTLEIPESTRPGAVPQGRPDNSAGIDIRWTDDGACIVELRGRLTRPMLSKARDLLWSRSPQERLTIVVSDAVLTRELFAMLIAGRRRLRASGVFEIVGLDAPGARRIAESKRPERRDPV